MLYDQIAALLDTKLRPSGWLSEDAYRFWQKRNPEAVQWHRQLDHLPGLWLSPKQLITLKAVAEEGLKLEWRGGLNVICTVDINVAQFCLAILPSGTPLDGDPRE